MNGAFKRFLGRSAAALLLCCAAVTFAVLPTNASSTGKTPAKTGTSATQEITLGGKSFASDSVEIDLTGCKVTAEEVETALPALKKVKTVILTGCGIDDDTLFELNQKHPEVSIVWTVYVGKIAIRTDEKFFYVGNKGYLPNNEEVKNLRYCPEMIAVDVGHLQVSDCSWLYSMPHVKYLILADTGITDITPVSSLKELVYVELFNMNLKDYSPLLECTALQDLNISSTSADPEPLSHMTWLHNLHWYKCFSNPETKEAVAKLPEQLPDTVVWLDMVGNISNPWRNLPNYYVFRDIISGKFLNQSFIWGNWGNEDAKRILACDGSAQFAGDVLAEIVQERIESGKPIIGIKDVSGEKAANLLESLRNSHP